jgi:hypothetical protein
LSVVLSDQSETQVDWGRTEYRATTNGDLCRNPTSKLHVEVRKKNRDKLFRHGNSALTTFRKPPRDGPPIPRLGDLVRTHVACRYIDGVEFLANKIFDLAEEMKLRPTLERDESRATLLNTLPRTKTIFRLGATDNSPRLFARFRLRLKWRPECGKRRIQAERSEVHLKSAWPQIHLADGSPAAAAI